MTHGDNLLLVGAHRILYEIRRSPRRRTLAIEVHPDQRVIVRAPERVQARFIIESVTRRGPWICRALERVRRNGYPAVAPLLHLAGETHHYLGQPYTLEVRQGRRAGACIAGANIRVTLRGEVTPERTCRMLEAWYRERLLALTGEILAAGFDYFRERGHDLPGVRVRRMRTRWGSLAGRRRMTLNLALIRVPRACLEFVVAHELCHLEYRGHGRGFYRLLDAVLPDWRERKRLLPGSPGTN